MVATIRAAIVTKMNSRKAYFVRDSFDGLSEILRRVGADSKLHIISCSEMTMYITYLGQSIHPYWV
jgi:hypothetical protein